LNRFPVTTQLALNADVSADTTVLNTVLASRAGFRSPPDGAARLFYTGDDAVSLTALLSQFTALQTAALSVCTVLMKTTRAGLAPTSAA